jgi:hypothetical protein
MSTPTETEMELLVQHHRRLSARVAQLEDQLEIISKKKRWEPPELTYGQYLAACLAVMVVAKILQNTGWGRKAGWK